MSYRHCDINGHPLPLEPGKVVCVGVNYSDHAKEMAFTPSTIEQPTLFLKPRTALRSLAGGFSIPQQRGACDHEVELAVLIGSRLHNATPEQAEQAIAGYGLALDLTLRDVQMDLKDRGRPWECAKSFDGSCPVSGFVHADELDIAQGVDFSLSINGEVRQQTNTRFMEIPLYRLLALMSKWFTLEPGDIVLTGTPEGVGPLSTGDQLQLTLDERYTFASEVTTDPRQS